MPLTSADNTTFDLWRTPLFDVRRKAHDEHMPTKFQYVQCDIPEGMSIREWRDQQRPRRRGRLRRLLERARRGIRH